MDNIEKYREIMNKVKDMAPDDANVYLNLGISSEQLDDMKAAKEFYQKAIELDPELLNAYLNLASVILAEEQGIIDQMNELGMSAADNKKYEKLNKQKQEIYEEAKPILLKAYNINPDSKGVVQTLMNIYYQTGENDKAKEMKAKLDSMN
jgi:tetratricopeptide (TPR) repeat protein